MYLPNLKSVTLPVPEVIGGIPKNSGDPGYAHGPFSRNFFMSFCSDGPCKYLPNMKSATLPVCEIIATEVWCGGRNPIFGKGRP